MPDLSISFDGVSHAEASRLAQRLLRDYAREGGNAERLAVTRNDPETQSGGIDVVMHLFDTELTKAAFEYTRTIIELGVLAKAVLELCDRNECAVKIRTPRGELQISRGRMDGEELRDRLVDALEPPKS
jgi:hypothetical protein